MPSSLIHHLSRVLLNYYQEHFPGKYSAKILQDFDDYDAADIIGEFSFSEKPVFLCRILLGKGCFAADVYFKENEACVGRCTLSGNYSSGDHLYKDIHRYWERAIRCHLDSDLRYHMFLQSFKH